MLVIVNYLDFWCSRGLWAGKPLIDYFDMLLLSNSSHERSFLISSKIFFLNLRIWEMFENFRKTKIQFKRFPIVDTVATGPVATSTTWQSDYSENLNSGHPTTGNLHFTSLVFKWLYHINTGSVSWFLNNNFSSLQINFIVLPHTMQNAQGRHLTWKK